MPILSFSWIIFFKPSLYSLWITGQATDTSPQWLLSLGNTNTPWPCTALLMCLKKYSAIGKSAIGNYVVLYSKLTLKTVLLEVSYGKNE